MEEILHPFIGGTHPIIPLTGFNHPVGGAGFLPLTLWLKYGAKNGIYHVPWPSMEVYWDEVEKRWEKYRKVGFVWVNNQEHHMGLQFMFFPMGNNCDDQLENFEILYLQTNPYTVMDPWWRFCTNMAMGENGWYSAEHRNSCTAGCSSPHSYAIHVNYIGFDPSPCVKPLMVFL